MKAKFFIFSALFLALVGWTGVRVHAETASNCLPSSSDIKQISSIQNDPSLSYSDELKEELSLRKQLATQVISCAQGDATTLQSKLKQEPVDSSLQDFQGQLSSKLDDAENFYGIELQKLDGAGISGTQSVAKEVLAWRKGSYEPLAGEVNNFILWSENQNLFNVAQARYDQTARAVNFLQGTSGSNDITNAFLSVKQSFDEAQAENKAAKDSLTQFLPPDQSLALIKQSLGSLSDTYQKFFDLSTLINKLLTQ